MVIYYQNLKSRVISLIFGRALELLFFIILLCLIIYAAYSYDTERSSIVIIANAVLLLLILIFEWHYYYRYIYQYYKLNKNKILNIDTTNMTIQILGSNRQAISQKYIINKIIMHLHIRSKLPFENPDKLDDKIENFIQKRLSNYKRFKKIWYLELKSDNSSTFFITPLMVKLKDVTYKDIIVKYEDKPLVKYGS